MCEINNNQQKVAFYHGMGRDLFAKMMKQDHPGLDIQYERRPGINASIIQIAPNTPIPETFSPAKIEIFPDRVKLDKTLSSNIIRQIVPVKSRYVPESGGKPFVSHSARPIPNVMCKEQIKACAEMVAICRATNKDPVSIKKFFNKNWGLPDSFDVEKYSPVVDPARSKPWLRWETQQNYETFYAQDAQAMIHVTAGSYTNQSKFGTFAVDWAQIRNHLRIIATNVFLCEPGVIKKVLLAEKPIELNFAVNFLEHSEVFEPTFDFRPDNGFVSTKLTEEDVALLLNDTGVLKKTVQERRNEIYRMLPTQVLQEIRDSKELTVAVIGTFANTMELQDKGNALSSETYGRDRKIIVTQPNPKTVTRSLQVCLRQFLKSWILQSREISNSCHRISALYSIGKKQMAMEEMLKILDGHVVHAALNTYGRYYSSGGERSQFKELLDVIFGSTTNYPNFDPSNIMSILQSAARHNHFNFLQLFEESYYGAMHRKTLLSVHDFIDYKELRYKDELTIKDIQQAAFKSICSYFCSRYAKRIDVLKAYTNWRENTEISMEVVRLQTRMKFYPMMGIKRDEESICDSLYASADKFCQKRRKNQRERNILSKPNMKQWPTVLQYASELDSIIGTRFRRNLEDSELKAKQTLADIDRLGWDDQPRNEIKKSTWRARRTKIKRKEMFQADLKKSRIETEELGGTARDLEDDIGGVPDQMKSGKRPWHDIGEKFYHKWVEKKIIQIPEHQNTASTTSDVASTTKTTVHVSTAETTQSTLAIPNTNDLHDASLDLDIEYAMDGYDSEETLIKTTVQISDWYGNSGGHGHYSDYVTICNKHGVNITADSELELSDAQFYLEQWRAEITQESIESTSRIYRAAKLRENDENNDITSQPNKKDDE